MTVRNNIDVSNVKHQNRQRDSMQARRRTSELTRSGMGVGGGRRRGGEDFHRAWCIMVCGTGKDMAGDGAG